MGLFSNRKKARSEPGRVEPSMGKVDPAVAAGPAEPVLEAPIEAEPEAFVEPESSGGNAGTPPDEAEDRAEEPAAESSSQSAAEPGSQASVAGPAPAPAKSGISRLKAITIGVAVLLTGAVVAAPFLISDKAVDSETQAARTEIPEPPPSPAAGSAVVTVPALTADEIREKKAEADMAAKERSEAVERDALAKQGEIDAKAAAIRAKDDPIAEAIAKEGQAATPKTAPKSAAPAKGAAAPSKGKAAAPKQQTAKATTSVAKVRYEVPVGAFVNQASVKKLVADAKKAGVTLRVTPMKKNGEQMSRVTAGPYDTKKAADAAKAKLTKAKIKSGDVRKVQ